MHAPIIPKSLAAAVTAAFLCCCAGSLDAGVVFSKLGYGTYSAYDLSDDGSVAVGHAYSPTGAIYPFRWTKETGAVNATQIPASDYVPYVSGNGAVIASAVATGSDTAQAYRWTQADGINYLPALPGAKRSAATAISRDGSIILGISVDANNVGHDFRWTQSGGTTALAITAEGDPFFARSMSADGSVLLGSLPSGRSFLWTQADGLTPVGSPDPGKISVGFDLDSLGEVVVGGQFTPGFSSYHAFRWTATDGVVPLTQTIGFKQSFAVGTSDNGSVIIGSNNGETGFIWTPDSGMRSLLSVLTHEYGLSSELDRWFSLRPLAISPDGRFIAGTGNHRGSPEAWLLDRGENPPPINAGVPLPPVPEPSTFGLVGATVLIGIVFLRRRSVLPASMFARVEGIPPKLYVTHTK